jgi:hypothetical protein
MIKFKLEGIFERHKTTMVEKSFPKKEGIDYIEIFSFVTKMKSV